MAEPALDQRPRYAWSALTAAARAASGIDDLRQTLRDVAAGIPQRYPAERAHAATLAALLDGGEERWSTAVEAWRADGQRYELARALLALAEARATDRPAAAEALSEAAAIAHTLGAAPLLAETDTLARRLGVRPSGGHPAPPPPAPRS